MRAFGSFAKRSGSPRFMESRFYLVLPNSLIHGQQGFEDLRDVTAEDVEEAEQPQAQGEALEEDRPS